MPTSRSPADPAKGSHRGVPRRPLVPAALVVAVLAGGCGGGDKTEQPGGATSTTLSAAGKRLQAGLAAQGAGDLNKARDEYLAVVKEEPGNKIAHYDLGVVYAQLNDGKAAADEYRKALAIDPGYQPALFNLAVLLTPTDPAAAVSYYRQILAINPDDANVHFNLGLLLKQTGQEAEGNAEVGKALQLKPDLASRIPPAGATTTTAKK